MHGAIVATTALMMYAVFGNSCASKTSEGSPITRVETTARELLYY